MGVKRELSSLNKSYSNLKLSQRSRHSGLFRSRRLNQVIDVLLRSCKYLIRELAQMLLRKYYFWLSMFCFIVSPIALGGSSNLLIYSADFAANESIPVAYTCSGDNRSP